MFRRQGSPMFPRPLKPSTSGDNRVKCGGVLIRYALDPHVGPSFGNLHAGKLNINQHIGTVNQSHIVRYLKSGTRELSNDSQIE